jgi:hypothetical protein
MDRVGLCTVGPPPMSPSDLPKPFMPGDEFPPGSMAEFGTGDLDHDMWVRPNRGLTAERDILRYAISVDGYAYARDILGKDLFKMVDELRARCTGVGMQTAKFTDLRLWLFFTQRAWRHTYQGGAMTVRRDDSTEVKVPFKAGPDDAEVEMLRALHLAICDAWEREWPARSGRPPSPLSLA